MSDIYIELRSRIPVVAAKTTLGTDRIQAAQDRVGLSNEAVARQIPVSEKTWRRWKEAGEIPTAALPAVARVLRLEIVEANGQTIEIDPKIMADRLATLEAEVGRLADLLEGFLSTVQPQRRVASGGRAAR